MHSVNDSVVRLSDFNGHNSRHIDGLDIVHRGYGAGH